MKNTYISGGENNLSIKHNHFNMNRLLLIITTSLMLFTGSAKAQGLSDTYSGYTVADEGAWCWFADPRALHYKNESGTINATYIGYIDNHGSIKATQVDWNTNITSEVLIRSWFQPDDHDNPAFLVLPDERIMIIYSRHTDEACFYYRISTKAGDITSLGEEKRLATANNTTYPNPYILSDDPDHIYMCWRGIGWHPTVAQMSMPDKNDDIKFTWGPYQMVQSTGSRPYAKYISNGKDKIYLAYTTGHPDNEYPNWLYCDVFNVNDKCLYDIKGNKLSTVQNGTFAVSKTDSYKSKYPYTVVDATSNRRDWLWNMAFDAKGNPIIGMTKIDNAKTSHDYYYAKWNGSSWQNTFIVNAGGQFHQTSGVEMCYSGGMAVDRDNPSDVYCSVPVNGTYEIVKYTMSEDGKSVVSNTPVTKNSALNNARPFVIEGTKESPLRLSWMNGNYYYWIVNTRYPNGYPTSIMADTQLPVSLASTSGKTISLDMMIDAKNYAGDLIDWNGVTYGVNASTQKAYVKVGGKTYNSQNVLGTADSWTTENTATTGGVWFSKTKLGRFNLTMTYDGTCLTVYVNGVIDQKIECALAESDSYNLHSNVNLYGENKYDECLSQSKIKQLILASELDALTVPEKITTDIVLPAYTASNKKVTWTSSNPDLLSVSGVVSFPKKATEVALTANVAGEEKSFMVTVMPRSIEQNLMSKFTFEKGNIEVNNTANAVMGTPADLSKNETLLNILNYKEGNGNMNLSANTAAGFNTNSYGMIEGNVFDGLRSYTVLVTVTPSSLTNAPRIYDFGTGSGNSFFLRANALSAGIKYNGGTTTMVNGSTTLKAGVTYKLAVTFDAATKMTKIYVDGVLDGSGTANQAEPYMLYETGAAPRNYIGRTQWWDGSYASSNVDFVGTMDDFIIYNIALTQEEVCKAQAIPFQEETYAEEIVNGDFEGKYSVLSNSGVTSDRAIYVPEGWTVDYATRNENDFNALKNGDLYYSNFFASKTQNTVGGKQTMWIRQRWGDSSIDMFQKVRLPEGKYTLSADMFASDTNDGTYLYVNTEKQKVTSASAWQTKTFEIEADGDEVFTIGFRTIHTNSDAERICAFDNFILKADAIADGIFDVNNSVATDAIFTLDGRKVKDTKALRKGVYIKNSKKVVIQ